MSIFVGVDAGGSTTECVVERPGERTRAQGPAANLRGLGAGAAARRISETIDTALHGDLVHAVVVGAAGAGDERLAADLASALAQRYPGANVAVHEDALIALRAAIPHGDGIVLVAGTGSIAYGRFGERTVRAGGYGALLGDEGSGFAIGRAALALLLREDDGRAPHDSLTDAIAERVGTRAAAGVLRAMYSGGDPVATVAALAPIVLERAGAGERGAAKIVQAAAVELSDLVKAVVRAANAADRELAVVFSGGLLSGNSLLSFLIETRLSNDLPLLAPVKGASDPVLGALALARSLSA